MRHLRARWTSQRGVEIAPLVNGKLPYSAPYTKANGWSDIRIVECDVKDFELKYAKGKKLGQIFPGTDIAGNKSVREVGMGVRFRDHAINGNVFGAGGVPFGFLIIDGKLINDTVANQHWSALIVWEDGRTTIEKIDRTKIHLMAYAISCSPVIARNSQVYVTSGKTFDNTPKEMMVDALRARTGSGITKQGKLMGVVVDGDNQWDAGVKCAELGAIMVYFGCVHAINFDGGGSSSMIKISATQVSPIKNFDFKIELSLIPKGNKNRPGLFMKPEYITIHDTGNREVGADANAHALFVENQKTGAAWHFTVDDKRIIQHLPLNENGWHAGDGYSGIGNRKSIGIEICINADGDIKKAEYNAQLLIAHLMSVCSIPIKNIKQHNFWSGKNCPQVIRSRANGWNLFLDGIGTKPDPQPVQVAIIPVDPIYRVIVDGKQVVAARMTENILMEVEKAIVQNANEIIVSKA